MENSRPSDANNLLLLAYGHAHKNREAQGTHAPLTFHKIVFKVPLFRLHSCPSLHVRVPPECMCSYVLNASYAIGYGYSCLLNYESTNS